MKEKNLNIYTKMPKKSKLIKKPTKEDLKNIIQIIGIASVVTTGIIATTYYGVDTAYQVSYLKDYGVSTKNAIYAVIDDNYIQPELRDSVKEMDRQLEERFPDVKFHNSGSVVTSNQNWDDKDGTIDELAGIYNGILDVAVFNENHPNKQKHENLHRKFRHTVINENGKKEEYNGFQKLNDIRASKITEALTTYLEYELYGDSHCYIEYKYIEMMLYFISEDDLVKIAAEGTTEDLEELLAPYFDCDIIDLIDKTPVIDDIFIYGKDYIVDGLNERAQVITDAFFKSLDIRELTAEEKENQMKSFREYLSKNFVNSVDYFDALASSYGSTNFSK